MTTRQWIFALLRSALWDEPLPEPLPSECVPQIVEEARRQTVAGLLIDQLLKYNVQMPRPLLLEAFSLLEAIKRKNTRMNEEVARFAKLMSSAKLAYIVVKGQTLAAHYPNPLLRMPGDIDFLVNDYFRAKRVLEQEWNVSLPSVMAEKEIAFVHDNVPYELHTYLTDFGWFRHRRYWDRVLRENHPDSITIGEEQVAVMEPTLYAAYVFIHLFFHFVHEGIGLRHLCDWAILIHHERDRINSGQLSSVLKELGLLKAYRAFGSVLTDYLGLNSFPMEITQRDRTFQQCILNDVFNGGNFGGGNRQVKNYGLRYKAETLWLTLKNSIRYYRLAPLEMTFMTYRRVMVNVKLLLHS